MATIAVGHKLQEIRPLAAAHMGDGFLGMLVNNVKILTVTLIGFDVVSRHTFILLKHRSGAVDRGADAVLVVFANKQYRQVPQFCHVQRFVKGTLIVGSVAQKANTDLIAALHLNAFGNACRERERAADQRIAAHEAMFRVKDMHGTTAPFGGAGFFAIQLGHYFFGIGAAFDRVHVVAVAGDHIIMAGPCGFHDAIAAGFLPWIEVQKAANLALDISLIAAFLEAPRKHHFTQDAFFILKFHTSFLTQLKSCRQIVPAHWAVLAIVNVRLYPARKSTAREGLMVIDQFFKCIFEGCSNKLAIITKLSNLVKL